MYHVAREWLIRLYIGFEKITDKCIWGWKLKFRKLANKEIVNKAHFLVINDEKYIDAAKIGIKSFLACNWTYKVVIHTDENLEPTIKAFIENENLRKIVSTSLVHDRTNWKLTKFKLLMAMQGTREIYIDADTRCNGELPRKEFVTCFVNEGDILQKAEYQDLLMKFASTELPIRKYMLNTSFFCWNGKQMQTTLDTEKLFSNLEKQLNGTSVSRLSEQILISLLIQNYFPFFESLKEKDHSYDRGIIESSYLGTTGRQIYRR